MSNQPRLRRLPVWKSTLRRPLRRRRLPRRAREPCSRPAIAGILHHVPADLHVATPASPSWWTAVVRGIYIHAVRI
eukprot:4638785-Pleurochrysis_carterae.AAC.1